MKMLLIAIDDFNLATLIVGIISLCGVMVNIIVTSLNNRKKRYVDLIISERIRNMKNLEKYMSELISTLYAFMTPNCDFDAEFKNFEFNKQMILYSMNFLLGSDKSIGDVLCKLDDLLFDYSQNMDKLNKQQKDQFNKSVRAGMNALQILTRIYNKCEWERSKDSSLNGDHTHYDT
ncbi:MAG: hypothetical protein K2K31_01675 [Clostridia bacterium]|nr:hypothetical protein [Clostridia bacterium]